MAHWVISKNENTLTGGRCEIKTTSYSFVYLFVFTLFGYRARGKTRNGKEAHEVKQGYYIKWKRCLEMTKVIGKFKSGRMLSVGDTGEMWVMVN
jgi:hypothetical protein